jgi:ligand-binding sensor domain-containing protein/signal transduction histidine kinase
MLPAGGSAAEELKPGLLAEICACRGTEDNPEATPTIPSILDSESAWVDKTIDFDSAKEAAPGATLRKFFCLRWVGKLRIAKAGSYVFYLASDDGSRLFIDGKQVMENWRVQGLREEAGEIQLSVGDHELQVDYFQKDGPCSCQLSWKSEGLPKSVVPASVLFHSSKEQEPSTRWWPIAAAPGDRAGDYTSRTWQEDEGLPDNRVLSLAQTSEGYLWVGTQKGLVRFDGVTFTMVNFPSAPELRGRAITALHEGQDGSFWVGVDGVGAVQWKGGKIVRYDQGNGLAGNAVRAIYGSRNGAIWIATEGGLGRWMDGKLTAVTDGQDMACRGVTALTEDPQGTIWAAATELRQVKRTKVVASRKRTSTSEAETFSTVSADRQGQLWAGCAQGLLVFRRNAYAERSYSKKDGLADNRVRAIREDRRGNLWVGTYGGLNRLTELTYVDANGPLDRGTFLTESRADGASYGRINCIFEDKEGNLWIGSDEGLSRLQPRSIATYTKAQGLTANHVTALLEDKEENIWITTWGGGLNRLKDGKVAAYPAPPGGVQDLTSELLLSLCAGRQGELWIGGDAGTGALRFQGGTFSRLGVRNGLPDASIQSVYEDSRGRIWLGSSAGLSLFSGGTFTNFTTAEGLAGNAVQVILEDSAKHLWIGTDHGLALWQEGGFFNFRLADGLPHDRILALHDDRRGNLWVGTGGGGLCRIIGVGAELRDLVTTNQPNTATAMRRPAPFQLTTRVYSTREGLLSDEIFEILEDDYHNLWLSGPGGLCRVSKRGLDEFDLGKRKTVPCTSYGRSDGLTGRCSQMGKPGGWKGHDGRLWFATSQGVVLADPHVRVENTPPPVLVEEIIVDKKRMEPPPTAAGYSKQVATDNLPPEIVVPPGKGELEIHYTALSLQEPEKSRFRYRLEGSDHDWVEAGPRRVAYYNRVSPGHYQFRVIACNKHGLWNETGASVGITLLPHFWQTWWFLSLLAFGVVAGIAGAVRYVTFRKLQRQMRLLEQAHAVERERARIARDMHDHLGASLTRISLLGEMADKDAGRTEETRHHARRICETSHAVAQTLDEIVWATNPRHDTLDSLVSYLAIYAEEFFETTTVRCRIEVPTSLPAEALSAEMRHNLFLAFRESLNNIVKHAAADEVWVRVSTSVGALQIVIEDNGRGLPAHRSELVGNGLANMRKRLLDIGGEFELSSRPNGGTRLGFVIPVGQRLPEA